MFDFIFHHFQENRYQEGRADRDRGKLPRTKDSLYLNGYLSGRPKGLDDIVQHFSSIEAYLQWKERARNSSDR
ncbi:hypothetical protein V0288_11655 [Pannus brasiliensis CCIBt3594]|uniref:Uncharacterized protein n=1 Tax=Pannus brasiliensis CCIBt3594 TaxID=1427578 RepID=A0AAW9QIZ7_9CHRO